MRKDSTLSSVSTHKSTISGESSPKKSHFGDRFISARTVTNEPYNNFDTKSEIFALSNQVNIIDKCSTSSAMGSNLMGSQPGNIGHS